MFWWVLWWLWNGPQLGFSWYFSHDWFWFYGIWGGRPQRWSAIFIISEQEGVCYQHDLMLTLVNRLKQCLSEFSSVRLLFLPLSIQFSLKGSREAQPTPEGLGITLHILEGEPKLFGIFTYEKFSSSPPLIYLYQYGLMNILLEYVFTMMETR